MPSSGSLASRSAEEEEEAAPSPPRRPVRRLGPSRRSNGRRRGALSLNARKRRALLLPSSSNRNDGESAPMGDPGVPALNTSTCGGTATRSDLVTETCVCFQLKKWTKKKKKKSAGGNRHGQKRGRRRTRRVPIKRSGPAGGRIGSMHRTKKHRIHAAPSGCAREGCEIWGFKNRVNKNGRSAAKSAFHKAACCNVGSTRGKTRIAPVVG